MVVLVALFAVIVVAAIFTGTVLSGRAPTGFGNSPSGSATASPSAPSSAPSESVAPTASATSEASPAESPVWIPDQPPAVSINGVVGEPFGWCYGNACMDGAPWLAPLDTLPTVSITLPLVVLPGEAGQVEEGYVLSERAADGELPREDVDVENGSINVVPEGDWTRLVVAVRFDTGGRFNAGGDATYVWHISE